MTLWSGGGAMGGAIRAGTSPPRTAAGAGAGETKAGEVGSPMKRQPNTRSKKASARSKLATLICVKAKAAGGFGGAAGSGVREEERRDLEVGESGREAEERERRAFIVFISVGLVV